MITDAAPVKLTRYNLKHNWLCRWNPYMQTETIVKAVLPAFRGWHVTETLLISLMNSNEVSVAFPGIAGSFRYIMHSDKTSFKAIAEAVSTSDGMSFARASDNYRDLVASVIYHATADILKARKARS